MLKWLGVLATLAVAGLLITVLWVFCVAAFATGTSDLVILALLLGIWVTGGLTIYIIVWIIKTPRLRSGK
ncbi:hypothetical protein FT641_19120 [Bacillus paranthracis]|uniref:hypothetical protein n=1 Tax=Bacillus paranthracis TaxID=2026186 RepID=UPI00187A746D|nr:hypothetical protein [Bacillus paranthracis]MBE7114322.1 hypothetical protein [Bacillus paranthracis]MBE7154805.1 hypothetical protein [Bacillus paranthracis]